MDWHDTRCRNLDEARIGDLISCLSCGSVCQIENAPKSLPEPPRAAFQYPAIRQRTQFRLLWVYPAEFDTPIRCEIFTSIVDDADFEAISYTWADETGDDSKSSTILMNSVPFQVTRNCEMALKRVRARDIFTKICIWVDAICIDQTNLNERGHQVQLMPLIYSRARTVLVYIGESARNSSWAMRALESGTIAKNPSIAASALRDLFARRYFSRVWVLQEVALARKSVLICGGAMIPWQFVRPNNLRSLGLLGDDGLLLNGSQLPPVLHFDKSVYTLPRLLNLLDFASNCKAHDPRDFVYSLLGLLPGQETCELQADYTLDVDQVYTNTAHYLGRHFGWDSVFTHALSRTGQKHRLPSWVPDWSTAQDPNTRWLRDCFSESPLSLPKPTTTLGSKYLTFRGLRTSGDNGLYSRHKIATETHNPRHSIKYLHLLSLGELHRHNLETKLLQEKYLRLPEESAVFNFLCRHKIHSNFWFFDTRVITGTVEVANGQHPHSPTQSPNSQIYRLCCPNERWGYGSWKWRYLSVRELIKCLEMSYDGLSELLGVLLRSDSPRLVIPQHSVEWRFIVRGRYMYVDLPPPTDGLDTDGVYGSVNDETNNGNTPNGLELDIYSVYSVILGPSARDSFTGRARKYSVNLFETAIRLRELATGDSPLLPDTQRATRMAVELLEANYLLELYDICIV